MVIYELRTYTLHVGKMAEAVRLYTELEKWGQTPLKEAIGQMGTDPIKQT